MGSYNQGRTDTCTSLSLKLHMVHCFNILRNLTFPPTAFESLSVVSICFARVTPFDSDGVYIKIKKWLKIRLKKKKTSQLKKPSLFTSESS